MAQVTYTGNVPSALALNYTRNVGLSGTGGPAGGQINLVRVSAFMSTNAYGITYTVTCTLNHAGGSTQVTRQIQFNSSNYGGAWFDFDFPTSIGHYALNSFDLLAASDGSKIFVKSNQTAVVDYTMPTPCGAPTAASVPSISEGTPNLSYSGAYGGTVNGITGYEIQYAESANGSSWSAWAALKTISTTGGSGSTPVALPSQRGYYRKYRLRTMGSAGAAYYSGWKETGAVKYNTPPTGLSSMAASPEVYVSGEITLVYGGSTDVDNNLAGYQVQYATLTGDTWDAWVSLPNNTTKHTPSLSPGQSIKYRARAVDTLGAVSAYTESNVCGKNTAPSAPTIAYPQPGVVTHNSRPRALVILGSDPEGHQMSLAAEGWTASRSSGLAAGDKVLLRKSVPLVGSTTLSVQASDKYGEQSGPVSCALTAQAPEYADAAITAGTTRIKAAHINEIRNQVNTVRGYYGLPPVVWAETIVAESTSTRGWRGHVEEIRAAIDAVVALVNGWDTLSTTNRVPSINWIGIKGRTPQADVMMQLRAAVAAL